jgi:hypothetical protein
MSCVFVTSCLTHMKHADHERLQIRDADESTMPSMTEERMAQWRLQEGARLLRHQGRYWEEPRRGFFQPMNVMARLKNDQATSPSPFYWGYRAALVSEEGANGSIPMHVLDDVQNYHMNLLSSNRRYHLRKCLKVVEIVEVTGPSLFEAQGYDVIVSAQTRTGNPYRQLTTRDEYVASLDRWMNCKPQLILAGLIDGKLGGYLVGYAIDGTAYIDVVDIATEALTTNISTGLHYVFVQICQRTPGIREVVHSPHIPEDHALGVFKQGMGFTVKQIPAKIRMNPVMGKLLRWRRPFSYYRLTGDQNACNETGAIAIGE